MENIKQIIAKNLVELRKKHKLTQQELASKLNYSDKAISRWEHGETLPDIEVLCRICDIYAVRFEYLLQEEQPQSGRNPYVKADMTDRSHKIIISVIAMISVWLLASVLFVYSSTKNPYAWMVFIWAVPVTSIVGNVCNKKWGTKLIGMILSSLTAWSLILSVYLQQLVLTGQNMWMFFIVGVPIEALIVLTYTLKETKRRIS